MCDYRAFDVTDFMPLTILCGGFGSGKTEIAVNGCVALSSLELCVTLVDIDLVKPLFRSREARFLLSERGVRTVCSMAELESADMPALSPEIEGAMASSSSASRTIVDVGGDDAGATALGRFRRTIDSVGYEMLMVVNPYRPFTRDVPSVLELARAISFRSGLTITGLVSNPNLGSETEARDIREGHELVCRISDESGLPVRFMCVWEGLLGRANLAEAIQHQATPVLPVRQYMLPPWLENPFGTEER